MPLAHPINTSTTDNYGRPLLAVTFLESRPGEVLADFEYRVANPPEPVWGMRGPRQERVELILTMESAARLAAILADYLGQESER